MAGTPAKLNQADIRRVIRAAKAEGVVVEVQTGGVWIRILPKEEKPPVDQKDKIKLW
jgi:hypothetical protein